MKWFLKAKRRKKRIKILEAKVEQLRAEIQFIKFGTIMEENKR